MDTMKAVVFIPKTQEEYKMWMTVRTPEDFLKTLDVDEVFYN